MVTFENDKHIYAGFTNMAQHNFNKTLKHILLILIGKEIKDDEVYTNGIKKHILKKEDALLKEKLCRLLNKHFPFLAPMEDDLKGKDGKYIKSSITCQSDAYDYILGRLNKIINFYRNYTTHYNPDEDEKIIKVNKAERDLIYCFKSLFKASIRLIQQRFACREVEVGFLKNKDMGKDNFKYCLYKKELVDPMDEKPSMVLSRRGLILVLSLFLEKKYISELLQKSKDFYTYPDLSNTKRKSIIFETLAAYRIKLPRTRYETETTKTTALALDMLNELQRCPRELFELLNTNEQNLFRTTSSVEDQNNVLMLRHGDRFPELALKYIDTTQAFNTIRFQVELGKYRFAFYNKRCIDASIGDGEMRVRLLQKELHGFGRLDEIENERRNKWATLIRDYDDIKTDTPSSTPYITDHHANYLINNNRIGLYWKASKDDPTAGLPILPENPEATNLRERKKNGERLVKLIEPKCFMSTHELPALVFYILLYNSLDSKTRIELKVDNAEQLIKKTYNAYRSYIQNIITGEITTSNSIEKAKEFGIDFDKNLPKKLKEYLSDGIFASENDVNDKLSCRLDEMIDKTQHLIERFNDNTQKIESNRNRRGRRDFVEIKPGKLAAWLAKDIIALQPMPKDGGNKLTGLNFQILQSNFAVYNDIETVKRVLQSAQLIDSKNEHPFLRKVVDKEPTSIIKFYNYYLEYRLSWLESIKDNDLRQYKFLTRGEAKWEQRDDRYYRRTAEAYLSLPVELPRSLFANGIKTMLSHLRGKDFIKGSNREDANVSFLILKYLQNALHDNSQDFYTQKDGKFKRNYRFFEILRGEDAKAMSIEEIKNFLMNDISLQLLNGNNNDENIEVDEKFINEVKLKLAKAKAKNPSLDEEKRIAEIIKTSVSMKNLPLKARDKIIKTVMGKAADDGEVKRFLNTQPKDKIAEERTRLSKTLHSLKTTERIIRRYRVQDIIIFLMARNILFNDDSKILGNSFDALKLSNIRPIGDKDSINALEIKVPFKVKLKLTGTTKPIVIHQKELKLKNYGDFHKFLYDSRIATLIPYLSEGDNNVEVRVEREDLERELDKYNHERYSVFENVHLLEKLILERHRELLDKNSPNYYYQFIRKGETVTWPVRSNFNELLGAGGIEETKKDELKTIRNAFAHNHYGNPKIELGKAIIGEIAKKISDKMADETKKINLSGSK